jgi:gliding-associated putative ABC transporter substrate-binding component GldG
MIFKNILSKIKENNFFIKNDKYLTIIIVIGLLAVINFFAVQIFFRADLTSGGDYSISQASRKTAAALDDTVNIKAYFSKNLPAKYLNLEQEAADILAEYANYSKGKIKVKIIDPSSLKDPRNELAAKGIPTLQINVMRNDEFRVVDGYLGILIEYGGESQTIPVISDTRNFEYEITSAIKKLAGKEQPVLGLTTSNGAMKTAADPTGAENSLSQAYGKLAELYKIKTLDLNKDKITDDISALLIIGPKEKFSEDELKKIDAFAMKGKSLIILADGVNVSKGLGAAKNDLGLEKLLAGYGIKLNSDLISDFSSNGRASFSFGNSIFLLNYPLWPKILPNNLDQQNVMTANLSSLVFPWASSLEVTPQDGENVSYLVRTTANARAQKDNFILDPQAPAAGGQAGQYDLAVFVSGKLTSPFGAGTTDKARIIVVGDSDFASDMFAGDGSDNLLFFQNIVDGVALGSDLISIRAKSATERPIKILDKTPKEIFRYANIFGVTILALIFGLARYFLRRRSKKAIANNL